MITKIMRAALTRSFKPFIFQGKYDNNLDYENQKDLGLYVHIPFCRSLCSFCPYCKVVYDKDISYKYKNALIKEIDLVGLKLEGKKEVTSLYFGGGTPTLMIDDLKDIIGSLKKYFIISEGIGVEIHPNDINNELIEKLKTSGITMVSIGVQSFSDKCLNSLGRKSENYIEKLKIIKEAGFDVVDVDLIFAIPSQTTEDLLKDIEIAFENGATQISTYPFIDFTFANNKYKPLKESQKKKMLKAITEYCRVNGYERTSVWTFAKKSTEKYSSITRDNFLGFGVSSTTLLREKFKINTFSIDGYIDRINNNNLPTALTLDFSKRQRAVYYLFWSCYSMTINPLKFQDMIGKPLNKMYRLEIWLCIILGFIKREENKYKLTDKGAYYYHYIEQRYTTAYIDKMWNIARKTPFPKEIILK